MTFPPAADMIFSENIPIFPREAIFFDPTISAAEPGAPAVSQLFLPVRRAFAAVHRHHPVVGYLPPAPRDGRRHLQHRRLCGLPPPGGRHAGAGLSRPPGPPGAGRHEPDPVRLGRHSGVRHQRDALLPHQPPVRRRDGAHRGRGAAASGTGQLYHHRIQHPRGAAPGLSRRV